MTTTTEETTTISATTIDTSIIGNSSPIAILIWFSLISASIV